jgi:hypothetical protein
MALTLLSKTVTNAGTRVALNAVALPVKQVIIQCKSSNTGKIFVGDNTVSSIISIEMGVPQSGIILPAVRLLPATAGGTLDLNTVYIDSAVNGEGVNAYYET